MSTLGQYLIELQNFESSLQDIIINAIVKKQGLILSRLKLRLFNTGVDGSGNKIEPPYTDITIERKKGVGQRTSHVTLRDTGIFYASMYVNFDGDFSNMFVDSNDSKYSELKTKYGDDILGLTKEDQEFIIFTIIEPEIIKALNKLNNTNIDL